MRITRQLLAAGLLALAGAAQADALTCERMTSPEGFTLACKAAVAVPAPTPTTPTTPAQPPAPPDPPPATPPASACPPNVNPFICAILGAGNPSGNGGAAPSAPSGNGTTFEDPTYDWRNGAIRRYPGGGGSKTAVVTTPSQFSFSIGDSGGNAEKWRVVITVNGSEVYAADRWGYEVTPTFTVGVGDVVGLTLAGNGSSLSARLELH